jgi:3-hydroxy-9,10-secoandrosta-1,3,5(10)-triene-9,17-dione monooxygenase
MSDATLTRAELVERARALVPTLRERAMADPEARRVPVESVDDLRAAGLLGVLQAERNGGLDLDLTTHLEVVATIAEGCCSTGWVLGVAHAHSWLLSHFPAQAQDEVYRPDPGALVAGVITPRGEATPAERGYLIRGVWPFGSGIERSTWTLLGVRVVDDQGATVDEGNMVVPTGEVTVADDWYVSGLKATGSATITTDGLFVPEHRFLSMRALAMGDAPGTGLHSSPLARSAVVPVLTIALTGSAIGAARAAQEAFRTRIVDKTSMHRPELVTELASTHALVADAATVLHDGESALFRCARVTDEHAVAGQSMVLDERARMRMDAAHGVRRCLEAVERLYLATGGSGLTPTNPVGRALADLQAINMHGLMNLDAARELYGRVLLGLDPDTTRL